MRLKFFTIIALLYNCIMSLMSLESLIEKTNIARTWLGRETDIKEVPYIVALEIQREHSKQVCNGVIIHPQWILSAAKCLYIKPLSILIKYGTNNRLDPKAKTIQINIAKNYEDVIYVNPLFSQNMDFLRHDIALIKLTKSEQIVLKDTVGVAKIESNPWPVDEKNEPVEIVCEMSGFGMSNHTDSRLHKSKFLMKYGRNCECFRSTTFGLCSKKTTVDDRDTACFGDWGGPIMCSGALVGIFSNLGRCSNNSGPIECNELNIISGYTYVQYFIKWIQKFVNITLTPLRKIKSKCEKDVELMKFQLEKLTLEKEKTIFERENEKLKYENEGKILTLIRQEIEKAEKNRGKLRENLQDEKEELLKERLEWQEKENLWKLKQKRWEQERKQWQEEEHEHLQMLKNSSIVDYLSKKRKAEIDKKRRKILKDIETLQDVKQQLENLKDELLKKQEEIDQRDLERHREGVTVRTGEAPPGFHRAGQNIINPSTMLIAIILIKVLCYE